ncbi:LysM peptidoglycan-binding domain-containing protein [Parapedobacter sp. ISTM3]|uniref:LysM repeat-containing protein n=1 Tax=Parapedobacter luteus TaxID=623280 RepID=A0A1T5ARJ3_9SPHI|nr:MULTISPECIES: LysM peptidoglycan-binding domain-containing protein [Parapedobacter]MBK1441969.1 LysM peptidoglycan-binding domain-containing protein [Parapedobacter sp. ISTM3]SKB37223.1 LysM repeat-containing protein [Parapedobacter luteus]
MSITYKTTYLYRTSFFMALLIGCCSFSSKASSVLDSIGVSYENGKKIVIHQLEARETYYGLSRQYGVPVKQIIAANGNKSLKVGDTVRIPAADSNANAGNSTTNDTGSTALAAADVAAPPALSQDEYTAYKVGNGETLFNISKRFVISVESIKRANGLTDEALKAGTILKIPNKELPPAPPKASQLIVTEDSAASEADPLVIPENRYGIREMTEKGVGVWIDDLNQGEGSMLALHKTAPIGTVIKITNPMTNRTALIKVVGKFAETAETKDAIIVVSKSAASLIGVLDRRFQVEISYGTPNDSN